MQLFSSSEKLSRLSPDPASAWRLNKRSWDSQETPSLCPVVGHQFTLFRLEPAKFLNCQALPVAPNGSVPLCPTVQVMSAPYDTWQLPRQPLVSLQPCAPWPSKDQSTGTHVTHAEAASAQRALPFLTKDVVPATQPSAVQQPATQPHVAASAPLAPDHSLAHTWKRKRGEISAGKIFSRLFCSSGMHILASLSIYADSVQVVRLVPSLTSNKTTLRMMPELSGRSMRRKCCFMSITRPVSKESFTDLALGR